MDSSFPRGGRKTLWLLAFLGYTVLGLWNLGVVVTGKLAAGESVHIIYNIIDEMSATYCGLALLPLLLGLFSRFPLRRGRLAARLPLYFLSSFLYAGIWMSLMWMARSLLYLAFGLETYRFGRLPYQYLMETLKMTLLFWIIYGLAAYFKASREREEQRVRASRLEGQLAQARLKALQARLHPHFLFNTLNMISSMIYEDTKAADKMIADLSDLLRMTMNSSSFELHPLANELEILRLYVDIMKARYRDKLVVDYRIEEGARRALVPGFILQPLVENSIKHGMTAGRKTEILISASERAGRLELAVEDNGPGLEGGRENAVRDGLGLTSTVERLENLYGVDHEFHLENREEKGLRAVVEVPFRIAAEEKRP